MSPSDFELHDLRDFPLVRISGERLEAGHGARWTAELDALFMMDQPFVLLALSTADEVAADDRRVRARYLKDNRDRFRRLLRAMISVEPNPARRLARKAQAATLGKALGLTMVVAATREEAEAIAAGLVAR